MDLLKPIDLKRLRNEYGIPLIEVAATCGLPAALIEQIEDEKSAALDTDLERITGALRRIIVERTKQSRSFRR